MSCFLDLTYFSALLGSSLSRLSILSICFPSIFALGKRGLARVQQTSSRRQLGCRRTSRHNRLETHVGKTSLLLAHSTAARGTKRDCTKWELESLLFGGQDPPTWQGFVNVRSNCWVGSIAIHLCSIDGRYQPLLPEYINIELTGENPCRSRTASSSGFFESQ